VRYQGTRASPAQADTPAAAPRDRAQSKPEVTANGSGGRQQVWGQHDEAGHGRDTMLGRKVAETIVRHGTESLFADEVIAHTRSADLFVLNLECSSPNVRRNDSRTDTSTA
jgi:hypothetical protein